MYKQTVLVGDVSKCIIIMLINPDQSFSPLQSLSRAAQSQHGGQADDVADQQISIARCDWTRSKVMLMIMMMMITLFLRV